MGRQFFVLLFVFGVVGVAAEAQAGVTSLLLNGEPGDFIVGPQTLSFTPGDGTFTAHRNSANGVSLSFETPTLSDFWSLDFSAPNNAPLAVGAYEGATRFPFQLPDQPGLSVDGDGRGCNTLTGRFEIKEIVYGAGDTIASFWALFEQHCEGDPAAAFGEIRFNADVTVVVSAPPHPSVLRGTNLTFDVSATDVGSGLVTLSALDLPPGATFTDHGNNTGTFTWTPGLDQIGDYTVAFHGEDGQGQAEQTTTRVSVTGVTSLSLHGDPGDFIVGSQDLLFTADDGTFIARQNVDNGVSISFETPTSEHFWSLDFAAPHKAPLAIGVYEGATRYPFQDPGQPGLDVSGDGRGCNVSTGQFEIRQIAYGNDSAITAFWAVFEQHCEGGVPAAYGEVRFNADVVDLTVTKAGRGRGTVSSAAPGIACGDDCTEGYHRGDQVVLTATPGPNSRFSGWSGGGCTGLGACTVTMDDDTSITATFTLLPWTLNVMLVGAGTGTVTSNLGGINCGSICSASYLDGTVVTLTATAASQSALAGWTGCDITAGTSCTVALTANRTVTATFVQDAAGSLRAQCAPGPAELGVPYTGTCTARGGLPPYACTLVGGNVSAGLTLNGDCSISGTPTTAGTATFTTRVADSGGLAVTIGGRTIVLPRVSVTTTTLPKQVANRSLVTTLQAVGGQRPYAWSVIDGALPAGVTLKPTLGQLTGTPTALGVSTFTVRVTDALRGTADRPLQLVVNLGPFSAQCTPGPAELGVPYTGTCTPRGGLPPYSCTLVSGGLPSGLTLNGDCTITGTPSDVAVMTSAAVDTSLFTALIADSGGSTSTVAGRVTVLPHISVTTATLPKQAANKSFVTTLQAGGGQKPYMWSILNGAVPQGVTLNARLGQLSGTPAALGVSRFTVGVLDALGGAANRSEQLVVNLGPLTATCAPSPGEVGVLYSGACTPRGGLPPYACTLVGGNASAGLTLNGDCTITGTPTTAGTATFLTRVSDSGGLGSTIGGRTIVLPHVSVATLALPAATLNKSYTTTLLAVTGQKPYTWSIVSGNLSAGLTLNAATGVISGISSVLGYTPFTVRVTDALGGFKDQALNLAVDLGPLTASCTPSGGEVGVPYSSTACVARAGLPPYACSPVGGNTSAGLTLNGDCTLTGTPTSAGAKAFTARVADSGGLAVNVAASVKILPAVSISTATLPTATVNKSYTTTLVASGGQTPYAWAIASGNLSSGLTLNGATGVISGTPTAIGMSDITFQVTDGLGGVATRLLHSLVNLGPFVARCAPASGTVNVAYSDACTPMGGLPPYGCSLTGGSGSPPLFGLTLNSDCTLTGTPVTSGTQTFTVREHDAAGVTGMANGTLTIGPCHLPSCMPARASR